MIRISGPTTVGAIKLKNGIDVILFGDEHNSKAGLCKSCKTKKNCYYITEFLDKVTKKYSDIFIESFSLTPSQRVGSIPKYQDDVLGDVITHYHAKMYNHSRVTSNMVRVHYTDIRNEPDLRDLFKIVMGLFLQDTKDTKDTKDTRTVDYDISVLPTYFKMTTCFKRLIDAMVKSNNYQESIKTLLQNVDKNYNTPVHKIRKQLLKIKDRKVRASLLKFHKDRCQKIVQSTSAYNKIFKRNSTGTSLTYQEESVVFDTLMAWFTHIMDMYTLARMMYYIEKGDSSLFVSYAGSLHTLNYLMFFMVYLEGSEMIHYQPESNVTKSKRCVTLPKTFVNTLV